MHQNLAAFRKLAGDTILELYHVGSTSIVNLQAKPEIDILGVIPASRSEFDFTPLLQKINYRRGDDLSKGHQFYKKEINDIRTHKLHLCCEGHPKIQEMLVFRNYLTEHEEARYQYEQLKTELASQEIGMSQYLARKEPFIVKVLECARKPKKHNK